MKKIMLTISLMILLSPDIFSRIDPCQVACEDARSSSDADSVASYEDCVIRCRRNSCWNGCVNDLRVGRINNVLDFGACLQSCRS